MFAHTFYGLIPACDCRNPIVTKVDEKSCDYSDHFKKKLLSLGDVCNFSETACGCKSIEGSPARRLNQFGKLRFCGKNSGDQFLKAVRPDLDGSCPTGYKPCSRQTSPEATICYKEGKP